MIADVAEERLTPAARAEVKRLLATEASENYTRLDDISSWADDYRSGQGHFETAHFVDIPLAYEEFDRSRDCFYDPNGKPIENRTDATPATCIVEMLHQNLMTLADKTQPDSKREVALKFVVHFVGDIHQPLHAYDDGNRGGNDIVLTYFGHDTNFHAIWDEDIIKLANGFEFTEPPNYTFDKPKVRAKAKDLDVRPLTEIIRFDDSALLEKWASESHIIAREADRHRFEHQGDQWDNYYQNWAWPVIKQRLAVAGVRLAALVERRPEVAARLRFALAPSMQIGGPA